MFIAPDQQLMEMTKEQAPKEPIPEDTEFDTAEIVEEEEYVFSLVFF